MMERVAITNPKTPTEFLQHSPDARGGYGPTRHGSYADAPSPRLCSSLALRTRCPEQHKRHHCVRASRDFTSMAQGTGLTVRNNRNARRPSRKHEGLNNCRRTAIPSRTTATPRPTITESDGANLMPPVRSAGTYNATVPRTVGATRNPGHPAIGKLGRQGAGVPPERKKENPVGEASYASHLITLPVSVGNLETTMIVDAGASMNIASQSFISTG